MQIVSDDIDDTSQVEMLLWNNGLWLRLERGYIFMYE